MARNVDLYVTECLVEKGVAYDVAMDAQIEKAKYIR